MTAGEINPEAFSYGYDRLRFIKPIFINDTITCKITISDKRDHKKPQFGVVAEKLEVHNQKGQLVLVCEYLLMVNRKNTES